MLIQIPSYVEEIIDRLLGKGESVFLVGGSIRDILMGKDPKDWDLATSAKPDFIEEVFKDKKLIKTGERYGTLTLVSSGKNVEITTFRSEGNYYDGRHPDWVNFEKKIELDLSRRDFTINAIAYNKIEGIVDPFGGLEDIKRGIIRTVGKADERFQEDGLRILRAIRLSTRLSFDIEKDTLSSIKDLSKTISNISRERVRDELFKIFESDLPSRGLKLLFETGLIYDIFPELNINEKALLDDGRDFYNMLCILDKTPLDFKSRFAAFICEVEAFRKDKDRLAYDILNRFNCPKSLAKGTALLAKNYDLYVNHNDKGEIKKLMIELGKQDLFSFLELNKAKAICKNDGEAIDNISRVKEIALEIIGKNEPLYIGDLHINGDDILKMGFSEGVLVGEILDSLLEEVIIRPECNKKEILIKFIEDKWLKK